MGKRCIPRAYHNGAGFTGFIETEELYEEVRAGKKDWKPTVKVQMPYVQLPATIFFRLMELDRERAGIRRASRSDAQEGIQDETTESPSQE